MLLFCCLWQRRMSKLTKCYLGKYLLKLELDIKELQRGLLDHFQNSSKSTLLDHTSEIAHGAKHLLLEGACLTSFIHTFTHSLFIGAITASTVPESLCESFLLWIILCTKPSCDIDPYVFLTRRIRHWSFTPFKCILAFPMIFLVN